MQSKPPTLPSVSRAKRDFCRFCRRLYDRRLVAGVGGNMALRMGERIYLTPSGYSLRDVTPEDVVAVNREGLVLEGGNPTKDMNMHLRILRDRPDVNVVYHVHGAHIIAAAAMLSPGPDSLPPLTPGFVYYAYPLPMLPFMVPGTQELAKMVATEISDGRSRAILLQNHGLVTVGQDFSEAFHVAEEVDEAARIFVLTGAKAKGIRPQDRALILGK
jgi:ribulose-5-phosphate 4-epimerase/fuculose-1-phosphate aldolase